MNKHILLYGLLCFVALFNTIYSQNSINKDVDLSPLTVEMIHKNYTSQQIKELTLNTEKLNLLEYYYSKSFEIVSGQTYTDEQVLKIDILKYNLTRKMDENVTVFDESSGLNIILYSFNIIDQSKKRISPSHTTFSESQSKTNN